MIDLLVYKKSFGRTDESIWLNKPTSDNKPLLKAINLTSDGQINYVHD